MPTKKTPVVHDRGRRAREHVRFGARDRTGRRTSPLTISVVVASLAIASALARVH